MVMSFDSFSFVPAIVLVVMGRLLDEGV